LEQEYILMAIVIGGLVGIELLLVNTSNKIKFLQMQRSTVLQKYFTINIMLMKHMTLFSLKQLTVYQFSLETVETIIILVLIRKSNQRNRLSRKKKKTGSIGFIFFVFVWNVCHINLFIYSSIILYHERISNINYTFSWRICNLFGGD
jgi:lysylphosphatidylglycerol synthetase-like protein (DUF2156 family)